MRALVYPIMSILMFTLAAGCGGSTETTDAGQDAGQDGNNGGADCSWFGDRADEDQPVTPQLNSCHPGYQRKQCSECHSPLPRPNHGTSDPAAP